MTAASRKVGRRWRPDGGGWGILPGTPLRGRAEQLSAIAERLDGAVAGRGTVALVEGRPGPGKTALLAALTDGVPPVPDAGDRATPTRPRPVRPGHRTNLRRPSRVGGCPARA